ncbi:unnamed protein product, partial [Didymodactylos carnosus]
FDLVRKRLQKELKLLTDNPTPGIRIVDDGSDLRKQDMNYGLVVR